MKHLLILLLTINTSILFGQTHITQGESKSEDEELNEFKNNLCDGYFFLLIRSDDDKYTTPFKGNKFKFKHDGSVKAKIKGQKIKGSWTLNYGILKINVI